MNNLQPAMEYREKGCSIIPVRPDKKPFLKWEEYQTRKAEPEEIKGWFKKWPDAGVGIVTGKVSGLDVIDIDTTEGEDLLIEALGEDMSSFNPPMAKTPRGGKHLYVETTGESNKAGFLKGVDYRGQGGYIVAPPSRGVNGKAYEWIQGHGILDTAAPACPASLLYIINSFSLYKGSDVGETAFSQCKSAIVSGSQKKIPHGKRDETLFHLANCLVKGGMPAEEIEYFLSLTLYHACENPGDKVDIRAKIKSAMERLSRKKRNIAQEVREWVLVSSGQFLVSDCHSESAIVSPQDKHAAIVEFRKLAEEGIIESVGNRRGCYRRVETDVEPVNFLSAPTGEFPIQWPLAIHDHCIIYPGNIIVVAGSKSAGKTAFLLNVVKLNQGQHEVVYLNSEMGDTEFRKRLELFEDMKLTDWRFKAFHRSTGFSDLITPEKKIFIIDFLEVTTDFWKVAQYIQEVHRKLREGVCIIALQKSDLKDTGRGGDFSKEKSRLYLSLDYLPDQKVNRIKITDAKAWRGENNPRGSYRHYKLIHGSRYMPTTEWTD